MNFAEAMTEESTWTRTENGAVAKNTTGNACLDLFGTIGALRNADETRICTLFDEAYKEDPLFATKMLFYARDIRQGVGERRVFKVIVRHCAKYHPEAIRNNVQWFPEYGRWDDLYCLVDTPLENLAWEVIRNQLIEDSTNLIEGKPVSLLGKWLKSPDTSSKESRRLGVLTYKKFGMSKRQYKLTLKALRTKLNVVETKISAKKWNEINFSFVPSKAMLNYRKAFLRHDKERFEAYIQDAIQGKEKINSSTLYPYDLIEKIFRFGWNTSIKSDDTVEAQWRQLPNYVEPGTNAIVMADTSGSMYGRPINSALGLAIYFAERNTGAYHNLFMSFSANPHIHKIKGDTLAEKLRSINMNDWDMNTNLKKAFDKVLDIAIKNDVSPDEMVKSIIVISDMEIDYCGNKSWTFYDKMKHKFEKNGYQIPNIIFWNVNSRHDIFHADEKREGVQLVSGQSTTIFKQLIGAIGKTPIELMKDVINSERYMPITVDI